MTHPFAMRYYCAFRPGRIGPNYHFNSSTDDNSPSMGRYPGLAFPNKDNVNCFVPSSESEYTIHKKMESPHDAKVAVEDQEKVIKASAAPIQTLQKGMGHVEASVINAFEHPVMKTSKVTVGAGKATKRPSSASSAPKKISKIKYI